MGLSAATWIAIGSAVASAGMGAMQQSASNANARNQAAHQRNQAAFLAAQSRNNAIIAQQNIDRIAAAGTTEEGRLRERIRQTSGSAAASLAANGLLVDDTEDSTAFLLRADIAEAGAQDIVSLRNTVADEKHSALLQKENFLAEAALNNINANAPALSLASPFATGAGLLLSGLGSVAEKNADEIEGLFGVSSSRPNVPSFGGRNFGGSSSSFGGRNFG